MFTYRGVAYDVGSNFATGQGELSRTVGDDEIRAQIAMIAQALNANAVTVYGTDLGRLETAARAAIGHGLHVLLDPRLVDHPREEILAHLADVGRLAETLRLEGASVALTVGAAHTIFTAGITPGEHYHQRMANIYSDNDHYLLSPQSAADLADAAPRLNAFLSEAATVARGVFNGEISYSAAPFEQVDWTPFDAIGLMYYYQPRYLTPEQHAAEIDRYRSWGKPIDIAGFGTATYRGAEEKAFFFWDVVDRSDFDELKILDGIVRDEEAQAAFHTKMFGIFDEAGIRGVTVTDFIHPTHPHSPDDPRLDLDTASLCIVKTIRERIADPASPYTYEPKASFHAIADYYGSFKAAAVA
ncbi:abortive infection protein [Dactylosporangium sp. NPDC049742]|uniref:abortive infection protein n=1 Tax=Dactylosporangium sp. NPDC049742 TaxID=3154737 RepID=UPI003428D3B8